MPDPAGALVDAIERWLDDPEGDVVYAEKVEEMWAVRMRQSVRDATTVWFRVGDYSLSAEAYVLPASDAGLNSGHLMALRRNHQAWRAHFALDPDGALVIRGRIANRHLSFDELDHLLGEVYEMVELSFRPLLRTWFAGREKTS